MRAFTDSGWKTKLPLVVVLPPTVMFHCVGAGAADDVVDCAYATAVSCKNIARPGLSVPPYCH